MSGTTVQLLNILFAMGSVPSTGMLIYLFFRDIKLKPRSLRTTITALIFLFSMFLLIALGNTVISLFFITDHPVEGVHYSQLRTLLLDATWFTVTWSLYLIHIKE